MSGASLEAVLRHSQPAPEPLRAPRRPSPCCSSAATDRSSLRAVRAIWLTSSQQRWRCSTRGMPSHVSDEPRRLASLSTQLTRSRLALKPSSARNGPFTTSPYFEWTSNNASTYALGSCDLSETNMACFKHHIRVTPSCPPR
jgi:hypothetical protein